MVAAILAASCLGIKDYLITYDIACKFFLHFIDRVQKGTFPILPADFDAEIVMLVNKFHLGGHIDSCADNWSLNYARGVGRFSGEAVESNWAEFNGLQYSTQEMGVGNRIETISDAFADHNWVKAIGLGKPSLAIQIFQQRFH